MTGISALTQATLYRNRRRSLAKRLGDGLKPFAAGLTVTTGVYVRTTDVHLNTIAIFVATSSGTSGATAPKPNTNAVQSDGLVNWQWVNTQILLTLATIPTPA